MNMCKIDTYSDLAKAKQQVATNYRCKCCIFALCKESAQATATLQMTSEYQNKWPTNIRFETCEGMICVIKHQT